MVVDPQEGTIAQRQFVIDASQQKVWDLLATVVFQELPLEKVDIVGLDSFNAVLQLRMAFFSFPFDVKGKMVDVSSPDSLGCVILVKKGPIRLGVNASFALKRIDESKVEVICTAKEVGKSTILGWGLRRQQRNFTLNLFDSIRARLQQICSS